MKAPSYGGNDPIAALATPLAESALAVIRTSGCKGENAYGAIELLSKIFSRPEKLTGAPGNSLVYGWIVSADNAHEKIDEVVVSVYRAPASYTGEDSADISCHGGIAAVKAVMAALLKAGFRQALPGEFTFRAFMNGKLDLTRAESVMELVSAKTGRSHQQAVRRLAGALEKEISEIKTMLMTVLAGTEIYLDYSEDEFSGADAEEARGSLPERALAEEAAQRLKTLSEHWQRERIYSEGALAVLAGRPNAGKSSLFNYLIREDRSIVTDVPGTTRDWIEAVISVEDIPLRLADTAGLVSQTDRRFVNGDEAERIGIQRTRELLEKADLVLYVIDGTGGFSAEDRDFLAEQQAKNTKLLIIWNKADIAPLADNLPAPLAVSAKTGQGITELLASISAALAVAPIGISEQQTIAPGTIRQKELIDSSLALVEEALSLANNEPLDIIAPLFRSAVDALGEITGEVSSADILEIMFSRFCVGK